MRFPMKRIFPWSAKKTNARLSFFHALQRVKKPAPVKAQVYAD
jgi:hypothetical protein